MFVGGMRNVDTWNGTAWDCLGLPGAQKITQLARKREYKHALGCYRYRHVFTPQFWNQPDVLFGSTAGSLGA